MGSEEVEIVSSSEMVSGVVSVSEMDDVVENGIENQQVLDGVNFKCIEYRKLFRFRNVYNGKEDSLEDNYMYEFISIEDYCLQKLINIEDYCF